MDADSGSFEQQRMLLFRSQHAQQMRILARLEGASVASYRPFRENDGPARATSSQTALQTGNLADAKSAAAGTGR